MAQTAEATTQVQGRSVTIRRVFDAPRELVWKAWTDPRHFARWFGTPPYMTDPASVSMDVRPGGEWAATQVSSEDGSKAPFVGRYREVTEPERLVMTFEDPEDRANPDVETATVMVRDVGDGRTEVELRQEGHLPEEQYELLAKGYSGFFDQLEKHLEGVGCDPAE